MHGNYFFIETGVKIHLVQNMNSPGELDLSEKDNVDTQPEIFEVTPELFLGWNQRGCKLKYINESDTKLHRVACYRDIIEGRLYMLERPGDSFSGYAETEASIQTQDACQSIVKVGVEGLEAFKGSDIVYEYNIQPSKDLISPYKWGFPIKPDALLMNGTKWLFLESKHTLTAKHVKHFDEKILFLQNHINENWFCHKKFLHRKPTTIVGAMCSISRPNSSILKTENTICLVRNGFAFVRHILHR